MTASVPPRPRGRFVYSTATTANGYLADLQDSLQWLFDIPGEGPDLAAFVEGVGAVVMGSTTYRWVLEQEDLLRRPARWQEFFGSRPVFVFTHQDLPVPQGAEVRRLSGAVVDHLPELRAAAAGGDVWIQGGGDLAGQFLDAGALDRIELAVAPAFLAAGRELLPRDVFSARLELVDVSRAGQFAVLVYAVDPAFPRT